MTFEQSKLLKVKKKKDLETVSIVHDAFYVSGRVPVTSHYYTDKKTTNI